LDEWRRNMSAQIAANATLGSLQEREQIWSDNYAFITTFVTTLPQQLNNTLKVAYQHPERLLPHTIWMHGRSDVFYDVAQGPYYIIGERTSRRSDLPDGHRATDLLLCEAAYAPGGSYGREPLRHATVWADELAVSYKQAREAMDTPISNEERRKILDPDLRAFTIAQTAKAMTSRVVSQTHLWRMASGRNISRIVGLSGMGVYVPRQLLQGRITTEEMDSFGVFDYLQALAGSFERHEILSKLYHHFIKRNNDPEKPVPPVETADLRGFAV